MSLVFLKEITDWGEHKIPNHTYIFKKGQCVGYMKAGTHLPILFKNPLKQFSKTRRKFKDVSAWYNICTT